MTPPLPRISVVTSSFNQGQFIEATIRSVLDQQYPVVEHIVVDGMSTDQTVDVLARYPHLRVIREPDRGQADAINKGFRLASGDIFCFLNSDDVLEGGALRRVAEEIDPARGRHIVMGRCRFIDEAGRFIGVEHPSAFESHRRVLEIWRGHWLPQPATFWTREVWDRCGPLDETAFWLDYDLFCRFSREYVFHTIDQVLASYRLHTESKTSSATERERLEASIEVSRRYWSKLPASDRAKLYLSYSRFRLNRRQRARAMLSRAKTLWRTTSLWRAAPHAVTGSLLAPELVWDLAVIPYLKPLMGRAVRRARAAAPGRRRISAQSAAWRDFSDLHVDGWAGPTLVRAVEVAPQHTTLTIIGTSALSGFGPPLVLEVSLNGEPLGRRTAPPTSRFEIHFPVSGVEPGTYQLRIASSDYVVPHDRLGNQDYRPLSFRLEQLRLE